MGNSNGPKRGIAGKSGLPLHSYIEIKCFTSETTMQYLYDYKDKDPKKQGVVIATSGIAIKEQKPSQFFICPISYLSKQLNAALPCGIKFIIHRNPHTRGFIVEPIKIMINKSELQKSIWKVVKYSSKGRHVCQEGDIFRLGWQKFKIKELVVKQSQNKELPALKHTVYENINKEMQRGRRDKHGLDLSVTATCRICLSEGTNTDPLIPPCACQGSMRYIHLKCLQDWLDKKLEYVNFRDTILINWKQLDCELCRTSYMHQIYLDGLKFYTVDIPVPERPYIVIEILSEAQNIKLYELISFSKKPTQVVGRSELADICLPGCVSVSRSHSVIRFDPETSQFLLEDSMSKYGTLVLQNKPIQVDQTNQAAFQVGNNFFRINMVRGEDETKNRVARYQQGAEREQFQNVIQYQDSQYDSKEQYSQQLSVEDFTRPIKANLNVNVLSIRPFQTNINESVYIHEDTNQHSQIPSPRPPDQIILNIPKSPRAPQTPTAN